METIKLACSGRPRAQSQNGGRQGAHWLKDVFHVVDDNRRTLCGINGADWLDLEPRSTDLVLSDFHLCNRCRAKIA